MRRWALVAVLAAVLCQQSMAQQRTSQIPVVADASALANQGRFAEAVTLLEQARRTATGELAVRLQGALSVLHAFWARDLVARKESARALTESQTALTLAVNSRLRAEATVSESLAYAGLEQWELALGARFTAGTIDAAASEVLDPWKACDAQFRAFTASMDAQLKAVTASTEGASDAGVRELWAPVKACFEPNVRALKAYNAVTTDQANFFASIAVAAIMSGVMELVDSALTRPHHAVEGAMLGVIAARLLAADEAQPFPVIPVDNQMITGARHLLLAAARAHAKHLGALLPPLSDRERSELVAVAEPLDAEKTIGLAFRWPSVAADDGLRSVLLTKQLLVDVSRQEGAAVRAAWQSASPAWQDDWQALAALRRQYATRWLDIFRTNDRASATRASLEQAVRRLAERIDSSEKSLRNSNKAYDAALDAGSDVTLEQVVGALRPGDALIEFVEYRPYSFQRDVWAAPQIGALIAHQDGRVAAVPLAAVSEINTAVSRVRSTVDAYIADYGRRDIRPGRSESRGRENEFAEASAALRALIWTPLDKELSGMRRAYVAPQGSISLVPFETLATRNGPDWKYLIESDLELVYLSTGRDLVRLQRGRAESASHTPRAVLIGDPAFDADPATAPPLATRPPGTLGGGVRASTLGSVPPQMPATLPSRFEDLGLSPFILAVKDQLAELGWNVDTLTRREASEPAALAVQAPDLLQFATHGVAIAAPSQRALDNPFVRVMLALAGANRRRAADGTEDGLLTGYEVMAMNLKGTQLVNLTACDTGIGELTPDGVASLREAFLLAGARAVTSSLWEVPAQLTVEQMNAFYVGLSHKPANRYAAFRDAQRTSLQRARQQSNAHPFYWAGITYSGDPGDLPEVRRAAEH